MITGEIPKIDTSVTSEEKSFVNLFFLYLKRWSLFL